MLENRSVPHTADWHDVGYSKSDRTFETSE